MCFGLRAGPAGLRGVPPGGEWAWKGVSRGGARRAEKPELSLVRRVRLGLQGGEYSWAQRWGNDEPVGTEGLLPPWHWDLCLQGCPEALYLRKGCLAFSFGEFTCLEGRQKQRGCLRSVWGRLVVMEYQALCGPTSEVQRALGQETDVGDAGTEERELARQEA